MSTDASRALLAEDGSPNSCPYESDSPRPSESTDPQSSSECSAHRMPRRVIRTDEVGEQYAPDQYHESKQSASSAGFLALWAASKRPVGGSSSSHQQSSLDPSGAQRAGSLAILRSLRPKDIKTIVEILWKKWRGNGIIDDRTMIMERTIQFVSNLPPSDLRDRLSDNFCARLWQTLENPPRQYVGPHNYRQADGSYNNMLNPTLGAAGSYYARSVSPTIPSMGSLPDPGLVFDALLGRRKFVESPNQASSLFFYWGTLISHDLFWSDPVDGNRNKTTSYLDLSPLYGCSQDMQNSVRTFKDGQLKSDAYADKRIAALPPGIAVLLIMFNRFHNYIATNLAAINEHGRFTAPSPHLSKEQADAAWAKYDEDLFQTARLITCGLYVNITLIDYAHNILNLHRVDCDWILDPRRAGDPKDLSSGYHTGRGRGNAVSAEFNLVYRWHSVISQRDEKWINDFYGGLLGQKIDPVTGRSSATPRDLFAAMAALEGRLASDPGERPLENFQRGPDGRFSDDDLVRVLTESIEECAGSFGARNIPQAMRPIEMLGILRARKWNLAGLNEFRKHFHLKPYNTFEEINSDPDIANQLRHLYHHPDNVELYPGIIAEQRKDPMVPGVGITPTYTFSRIILSDAICLVHGDRFYTTDYHPGNLTNWGYHEVDYDVSVNHGCSFYKLFLRAFPNHFAHNSVYAHYPVATPAENKVILAKLGRDHLFDFSRPAYAASRIHVASCGAVRDVLSRPDDFRIVWGRGLSSLMGEGGAKRMLGLDDDPHDEQRTFMYDTLYRSMDPSRSKGRGAHDAWKAEIQQFYAHMAEKLMAEKSYRLADQQTVDVIRDVGNLAHAHFSARVFSLPLKTKDNPRGLFTEHEMYRVLSLIFACTLFDLDPAKSFPLRLKAKEACVKLGKAMELQLKLARLGLPSPFSRAPRKGEPLAEYVRNVSASLVQAAKRDGIHHVVWSQALPTACAMVPNQAHMIAQTVDFYLTPREGGAGSGLSVGGQDHLSAIYELARQPPAPETDALLLGYAMEGVRLSGTFGTLREAAGASTIQEEDGRVVNIPDGALLLVNGFEGARDPERFPDPLQVNPRRPVASYPHYGHGMHGCLGRELSQVGFLELFRSIFRRKNLRRMPGEQGHLRKVPQPHGFLAHLTEDGKMLTPFPETMKIQWDE